MKYHRPLATRDGAGCAGAAAGRGATGAWFQTAALERSSAEVLTATRTAEAFHAALEQRNQQYKAATAALAERVRELKEVRLAYDTQTAALKRSSAKVMTLTRAAEALNVALKQRSAQYEATIAALTAKAHAAQTALAADLAQAKAELGHGQRHICAERCRDNGTTNQHILESDGPASHCQEYPHRSMIAFLGQDLVVSSHQN